MEYKMESQTDMYSFFYYSSLFKLHIYFINKSMNNQLTLVF